MCVCVCCLFKTSVSLSLSLSFVVEVELLIERDICTRNRTSAKKGDKNDIHDRDRIELYISRSKAHIVFLFFVVVVVVVLFALCIFFFFSFLSSLLLRIACARIFNMLLRY